MSFTICPSLGHNQRPPPHPSSCPEIRPLAGLDESHCSPSNLLVPGGPRHPCRLFPTPPSLSSFFSMHTVPISLSSSPFSSTPFSLCSAPSCPPSSPFLSPGLSSAGLAFTQSPSISSTSDIIRTEKSWEHSFPMILKWHQGHSGPVGWLAGWLANWLVEWLGDWLELKKKRPEAHNLAGLASGFPPMLAPKHLTVNTELGHFSRNILNVTHLLSGVIRCFIHKKKDQHLLHSSLKCV